MIANGPPARLGVVRSFSTNSTTLSWNGMFTGDIGRGSPSCWARRSVADAVPVCAIISLAHREEAAGLDAIQPAAGEEWFEPPEEIR